MALSKQERKRLLGLEIPATREVRLCLNDYLARTGLAAGDFAHRINYSPVTLGFFLRGEYQRVAANDAPLRAAIVDFMGRHPIAPQAEPEGKVYETENVRVLRRYFEEAVAGRSAFYVQGDPGTQKSFVLEHLVAELNRREISKNGSGRRAYLIYCREKIRPLDLVKRVAEAAGVYAIGAIDRVLRNLRFEFQQRRVGLIFDEAQHLDIACWETIRELHDRPPHCGLLFAGSHHLGRFFTTHALELEQWNSRFQAGRTLPGLTEEEAVGIVRDELGARFSVENARKLVKKSSAPHLHDGGKTEYVSARRLFGALAKIKAARSERQEASA